jgi:hypothetical protein
MAWSCCSHILSTLFWFLWFHLQTTLAYSIAGLQECESASALAYRKIRGFFFSKIRGFFFFKIVSSLPTELVYRTWLNYRTSLQIRVCPYLNISWIWSLEYDLLNMISWICFASRISLEYGVCQIFCVISFASFFFDSRITWCHESAAESCIHKFK